MKRIDFLRMLFGGLTLSWTNKAVGKKKHKQFLYGAYIAGTAYYEALKLFDSIDNGDLLELRLEPENKYDYQAVEILWNGRKLGYVPQVDNTIIYNLLKEGRKLEARMDKKGKGVQGEVEDLYYLLHFKVWMVEEGWGDEEMK